jgi:exonuclease SbcD
MRILHVSDLHLGRTLGDLSREAEQRALINEIVEAADGEEVALTLIAGDVFDAFTPPAWAEELFFELIDGLAAGGTRAVAVIAGNHDSGLRLAAGDALARRLGIILVGELCEPIRGYDGGSGRVRVVPVGPQVARIEVPGAPAPILAGLLPFLSEARVTREGDGAIFADVRVESSRYAERLTREIAARTPAADPGAVRVLMMHQFITGGTSSDSERRLRVGALSDLDASTLPAGLDYIALGHLHRPQQVAGAPSLAVYAGSPIAYSFSEAGQQKRAVLVTVSPGRPAELRDIPLTSGRPLEIWPVKSIEEALALALAAELRSPIVEVRADLGRRLYPTDGDALFNLGHGETPFMPGVTVVAVRDLHDPNRRELAANASGELPELCAEELFCELWTRKHGSAPDEETVGELLGALLEVGRGEASDDGGSAPRPRPAKEAEPDGRSGPDRGARAAAERGAD